MTGAPDGTANDRETTVRVRGIYATALTHRLAAAGVDVVQASEPIRGRFARSFPTEPATVAIETSRDRRGVSVRGERAAVAAVATALESVAIDAFRFEDETPASGIFDAELVEAGGGRGGVVDLGDGRRGYLPYDAVEGYVDEGDRYRVQVVDPTPPWSDDHPRVVPTQSMRVETGLLELSRDRSGVTAAVSGERGEELVGAVELLSPEIPTGWGLRWKRPAADATLDTLEEALQAAIERAGTLVVACADAGDVSEVPRRIATPLETTWCWFGRESRFALDDERRTVTTTMTGHHRSKAADRRASAAVDFAEAVAPALGDEPFPFDAVTRQFGPTRGDRIALAHGKPDGRLITLGRGEVTAREPDGRLTLERSMRGGGRYDALDVLIEDGDVAVTKLREGRWWYPTTYRDAAGESKGTYVNVCTPVELFPDAARYVDLYVDVIRHADGSVETVDQDELAIAREEGLVDDELAEKATSVARSVKRALSGE